MTLIWQDMEPRSFIRNVTYQPRRGEPRTTTPETLCNLCEAALRSGPAWAIHHEYVPSIEAATCSWCHVTRAGQVPQEQGR